MKLRITVDYDSYPDASWLEQWDTPEKYYGGSPDCPDCGWSMDYVDGHRWQCSDHDDPIYVEWSGDDSGSSGVMLDGDRRIPFDEYRQSYGDPNHYVYLAAIVEKQCEYCNGWEHVDSLCGIDFYYGGNDYWEIGTFDLSDVDDMPEGFFRDTLQEMIDNVSDSN